MTDTAVRSRERLRILQGLPLDIKIKMTQRRLRDWIDFYGEDGVYLSWSGGKDSTVLRHIIMQDWPDVVSVFLNTGLEYPEIQRFVKAAKDRGEPVEILYPEMRFDQVIKKYGYPIIGKEVANAVYEGRRSLENGNTETTRLKRLRGELKMTSEGEARSMFNCEKYEPLLYTDFCASGKCCDVMKKKSAKRYEKETGKRNIVATMAEESRLRESDWMRYGCNSFDMKRPTSKPMSFWTEQDVLLYIKAYNVEIPSVYGEVEYVNEPEQIRWNEFDPNFNLPGDPLRCTGCNRTGCIFCAFGAHLEKGEGRFERLKRTHPRQYEYCIGGGAYDEDGLWKPNKQGLGFGHVFDELNKLYGNGFIRY